MSKRKASQESGRASAEGTSTTSVPKQESEKGSKQQRIQAQVFEIAARESAFETFGRTLLEDCFVDYTVHRAKKSVEYRLQVPPSLCLESDRASPHAISTSALLALFDELSTLSLFLFDKTRRPGVSIELNTEIIRLAREGETIHMHTTCDKLGKVIAFCSLEVYNDAGSLLARGKHMKFQPMGWLWDLLASPFFLPLAMTLYHFFRGSKILSALDAFFRAKKAGQKIEGPFTAGGKEVGYVFKALAVTPAATDSVASTSTKADTSATQGRYKVQVRRDLMNPVGSMHGGAVACSIEEACRLFLQRQQASESGRVMLDGLNITYLSPLKVLPWSRRALNCLCFTYYFSTVERGRD